MENDRILATADRNGILRIFGDVRPRAKRGESIDLLKLVDPRVDWVQGDWKREGESIRAVSAKTGDLLVLPVATQGSYIFRAEFTRVRCGHNRSVGFFLPTGDGGALLGLDHMAYATSGFSQVDGRSVSDPKNPTNVQPGTLEDGRRYAVKAAVTFEGDQMTVEVTLDDNPYIKWHGPQSSLKERRWYTPRDAGDFALWTGDAEVIFHRLELKMLDGEAVYQLRTSRELHLAGQLQSCDPRSNKAHSRRRELASSG